jgi:hypothetical protein
MADGLIQIGATFSKDQLIAAFESAKGDTQAFIESLSVAFEQGSSRVLKTSSAIRQGVRDMAADMPPELTKVALATREVSEANKDVSRTSYVLRKTTGDQTQASKEYAAALQIQIDKKRELVLANQAALAGPANELITTTASSTSVDVASQQVAAATLAEAEAKAALVEITDALSVSTADESTQQQALAAAQDRVRATSAALAEAQAVLKERSAAAATAMAAERSQAEANAVLQERLATAQSSSASQRIAAATLENAAAQKALRETQDAVAASSLGEQEKIQALAPTLERARLATIELAEANKQLAVATDESVSGVQATSGAIRTLEGNGGIRAVENFLSKTLGLGPAMQAIFPVVGAIAFGKILFDIGEKVYDVEQKAVHAGEAIKDAFDAQHDKAQVSIDDLAIQNDKLQDQIDKLSGHPNSGLQTALDEARKMANQLLDSLQADRKELAALLKEHDVSNLGSALSGIANDAQTASTGKQGTELLADQKTLTEAVRTANREFEQAVAQTSDPAAIKSATDKKNQAVRQAFQSQIDAYKIEAARLQKEQTDSKLNTAMAQGMGGQAGGLSGQAVDNSAKIANVEGRAQQLQDALTHESYIESIASREQVAATLKQAKDEGEASRKAAEEANKAAEQRLRGMEAQLNEEKLEYGLSTRAVFDYWAARRDAFVQGSSEYDQVSAKMAEQAAAGSRAVAEEIRKFETQQNKGDGGGDAAAHGQQEVNKELREQAEDVMRTGDRWASYWAELGKGSEIGPRIREQLQEIQLHVMQSAGGLSGLSAAHAEAALHAEEQTRKLKALEDELERLEKAAKRDPVTGAVTDPKQAEKIVGVQNQIADQKGAGQVQGAEDANAIAAALTKPYFAAFDQINSGWLKVQNDLIAGNKNIGRDFAQMGLGLVQSMAANFEKMLVKQLQFEIQSSVAHHVANQQNVASDAISGQQSTAINAIEQIFIDAKGAAAGAYKAMAGIPVVGPELGAVAAAATFAGVIALQAFELGGVVDGPSGMGVPILAHAGERVLTQSQTNNFERLVSSGGAAGGGGDHFHLGGNSFSQAGSDFKSQWAANEMHIVKRIKTLKREGHL